jgi:cytidyltransferase-like protein
MLSDDHIVVIALGSFDPLHPGHIHYLTEAKKFGDRLIVGLELDNCIIRKHGVSFMNWEERAPVMRGLKPVDEVIMITDCINPYDDALRQVRRTYPTATLIFVSGNPQNENNSPTLPDQDLRFEYNVGADIKVPSSSELLRRYSAYVRVINEMESSPYRRYE